MRVGIGVPILAAADIPVVVPAERSARVVDASCAAITAAEPWMVESGLDRRMTCVSMGNPHVILYCRDVAAVPLEHVGPSLERHPIFPRRINVHFVQVLAADRVRMRTWERGSGITMACGTGASAVCV